MSSSSNRRRLHTSSEDISNATPSTLDADIELNLRLLTLLESSTTSDVHQRTPTPHQTFEASSLDEELNSRLTLHKVLSTSSSTAERDTKARVEGHQTFKKIGAGSCGIVFARDGQSLVVKLAKGDNAALWNDYVMHSNIASNFARYIVDEVHVPECYFFVPENETKYFDQYPGLIQVADPVINFPTAALVTERILPLPAGTRSRIIQKYCSERAKQKALEEEANKDCLVRVYLGSMHGKSTGMFFSLRNFKLHLNQMLELQLEVEAFARRMGIALALLHWAAKVDGRDVEFALGSSTKKSPMGVPASEVENLHAMTYTGPPSRVNEDFFSRTTEMWLLDFNQVRPITLDDAGVALAVEAVKHNDPYFPKPLRESEAERHVWKAFLMCYLNASDMILEGLEGVGAAELLGLPRKFIAGVIEVERERMKRRARED